MTNKKPNSPEDYIAQLPEERQHVIRQLRETILANLPDGFAETMSYGMIGYVVPHEIYPPGYHTNPDQPLPFLSIASQKNHIAVYHMGLYTDEDLMAWFTAEYPKRVDSKLDMGKSCIRLKKMEQIPYELLGELASKMTPDEWITLYEAQIKR